MKIKVNQEEIDFGASGEEALISLLKTLELSEKRGIAVAVNQSVISKTNWDSFLLKENDQVTIITATQGG